MDDFAVVRKKFAEWLSVPSNMRVPKNQKEFAEANGVSAKWCQRVKAEPGFINEIEAAGQGWFSTDDITDFIFALKRKAKDGNVQAIKLCLEIAGIITDGRLAGSDSGAIDPSALAGMDFSELEAFANGGS